MASLSYIRKTRNAFRDNPPEPPEHLSKRMKEFWVDALKLKTLQPFEVLILAKACEAYDSAEQARRILKSEGLTYVDRFQQPRPRPEVSIERDSKLVFAKLLKQLHLWNEYWAAADDD